MIARLRDVMNLIEAREVSDATALLCKDKSKTRQSDADGADINVLMDKMRVGYEVPVGVRVPRYGDFELVTDFGDAMNAIRAAQESFMRMSGKVRAEFNNDPQRFLEFCEARDSKGDLANYDRMVKLGLAVPPEAVVEPPVMNVRVVADPAAKPLIPVST